MLTFDFKPAKFGSAVAYLAERKPGVTKKELCKLLFFADKRHLLRYGRPITGERYFALEQGPIPARGLDALNGKGDRKNVEAVRKYGQLSGWAFCLESPPDLKTLSKTDIAVLAETFDTYGHLAAWQPEALSHQEPAWARTKRNGPIDFALFFEGHPEAEEMKAALIEEQQGAVQVAR